MADLSNEIEAIKSNANIVDIISDYIPLTQKGKNYFGKCPFHNDHSPSMSVSQEKQMYKCFSCGAAGNVFNFIQNYNNVSFLESVKIIADKIGYNIVINDSKKVNQKNQRLYNIMEIANLYYKNNLNTNVGKKAKEYLESRSMSEKVIKEFEIGLSLNEKDNLVKLLNNKGFNNEEINKTGLININGANSYDSFINRIMFPIHDLDGNVVAFTGRIYNNDDLAKYYNSRESEIFKKGEILFNYHRAKSYIHNLHEIIIVEGNMDAIRMYSSGFKNTIALMGTSLTKFQVDLIKKLNSTTILMLDNDSAGEIATINNGQLLENAGIDVKVVRLSDYKDPDDYLKNLGYEKMESLINNAISFIDFKLLYYKKNKNVEDSSDLVSYVKEVLNSLKNIDDNLTKEITLSKLSKEYDISLETLKKEIDFKSEPKVLQTKKVMKTNNKYDKVCEIVIYYLLNDGLYLKLYKNSNIFINNKLYRNIINEILYFYEKYNNIEQSSFINAISLTNDEEIIQKVLYIVGNYNEELNENDFNNCIKSIDNMNCQSKINDIKKELKETIDINKKTELINKLVELKKGSVKNEGN